MYPALKEFESQLSNNSIDILYIKNLLERDYLRLPVFEFHLQRITEKLLKEQDIKINNININIEK